MSDQQIDRTGLFPCPAESFANRLRHSYHTGLALWTLWLEDTLLAPVPHR